MFSITSSSICGIKAVPVIVETDVSNGMNNFTIVGLPDTSVKESRDRIRAALKNSGFQFPRGRITINLAPANLKKQGPIYDLPIALSILASRGEIPEHSLKESVVLGELALDGTIRPVLGVLTTALMARRINKNMMFIPKHNEQEAAVIKNLQIFGASSLRELVDHLLERAIIEKTIYSPQKSINNEQQCFSFIKGQDLAKRRLEVAASGGHNVLLSGPPGTGKTLLAKSFPSILPPLTEEESIEVTSIASVAGKLHSQSGLIETRPFRSPHHSSSAASLVGGGTWPTPGEISLAHRGVLFLDELPEFPRHVLEQLRGPLEDGVVTISRAQATIEFPARFQLLGAMNPCPCGYSTDPKRVCVCSNFQVQQYRKKISGPLMDRFDLRIEVSNLSQEILLKESKSESSKIILERVIEARKKQTERLRETVYCVNSEIPHSLIEKLCVLSNDAKKLLGFAINSHSLSPRATTRIRKIARTIADLAFSETIEEVHLAEALQFRGQKTDSF